MTTVVVRLCEVLIVVNVFETVSYGDGDRISHGE